MAARLGLLLLKQNIKFDRHYKGVIFKIIFVDDWEVKRKSQGLKLAILDAVQNIWELRKHNLIELKWKGLVA